jgi:hypothetical protein
MYEVCTAVAHCFPNILDVMVLENKKKLSEDEIGPQLLGSYKTGLDFCHQLPTFAVSSENFNHTLILYVH